MHGIGVSGSCRWRMSKRSRASVRRMRMIERGLRMMFGSEPFAGTITDRPIGITSGGGSPWRPWRGCSTRVNCPGGSLPMIVFTSTPCARRASYWSSACSTTAPQKDHEYGTTIPTFIAVIIVGAPVRVRSPHDREIMLVALLEAVGGPLLRALGAHGQSGHYALVYFRIAAVGLPAALIALAGQGYLRGISNLRRPLEVGVVANVVNVVLELLFVYGFHWGIAGSAAGTAIAQGGICLLY